MSQPIKGQGGHLFFFLIGSFISFSCQVSLNSVQWFQRRSKKNVSANQEAGQPSCFSDLSKKHKIGKEVEILLPDKLN